MAEIRKWGDEETIESCPHDLARLSPQLFPRAALTLPKIENQT